ncbi:polycomb group protein Psc-like [Tripterygium wilfordii]|uniref:polycomb group protein Psc-like n=1 Tax=Tripterygium wilfordii TaxID=458696 RepID=UPI0018F82386|nr:polycomb group protein Psc-like [Tripterygium wilfordii]
MKKVEEGISSAEVSVPFSWESRPGTPTVKLGETPLPPLTPPPSYFYNVNLSTPIKKHSKPKLLSSIFRRTSSNLPSSPASSSSSSSSSSQSWTSRPKSYSVPSSPRQSYKEVEDEEECEESPVATLCFGSRASARSRGCLQFRGHACDELD